MLPCRIDFFKKDSHTHAYDNACDATCNECNATRAVPDHVYDNACDAICNECESERVVPDHVYKNECDKTCEECGARRSTPTHIDEDGDQYCDYCDVYVPKEKMPLGAIIALAIGCTVGVCSGGFAIIWFVFLYFATSYILQKKL